MQAIIETIFDFVYLTTVITLGIIMLRNANSNTLVKLFGIMAIVLGCGDAFHLVPRAYALLTNGLAEHVKALGFGKMVTSITMTVFYVILYHIAEKRYKIENRSLMILVYLLAAVRIVLCFFPQNAWLSAEAPLSWAIYRNIPFALMGLLMIALFYRGAKLTQDKPFRIMWLAITLSFAFYIPVVLWADSIPLVGMLMIPKTCAYVWIVLMGWNAMKIETSN